MSRLKIYWPDESNGSSLYFDNENQPATIPFVTRVSRSTSPSFLDIVGRARTIHHNQKCDSCGSCAVDPVELQDATLNRNRLPIPGTATVVGFHCNNCGGEWPS